MNKLYKVFESLIDLLFLLLLFFCKPFAKIIVDVFYPFLSFVKDYELLSILIFIVPLLIFIFINKFIFSLIVKMKKKD